MFFVINSKKVLKNFKILITLIILIYFCKSIIDYILPIKYENLVERYSEKYNLEKELVLAVINAESRFDKQALSNKGAMGLMQILPETGDWLAEKIGLENFKDNMLYNPEINIQLGCYYLKSLLEKFENEMLGLCAYNAGSTNVYRWLEDEKYSLNGEIHTIPFNETDKYVKKIELMKKGYSILLKLKIL